MGTSGAQNTSFTVSISGQTGSIDDAGDASESLALTGIGSVVFGDLASLASETVTGGNGLSTVDLGNGNNAVNLQGAFNTVVLGDGNDVVNVGSGTGTVLSGPNGIEVTYGKLFSATLTQSGLLALPHSANNLGFFDGGSGNIGDFDGLADASSTSGVDNIGVFDGLGNGGLYDGDSNIGAFSGDLNGVADSSTTDGAHNGDGNVGTLNGDFNGNFVAGVNSGNSNGDGNLGFDDGNANGNGAIPSHFGISSASCGWLSGGFDTVVVGNGNDGIAALAGLSTIDAGDGTDAIAIGGAYDTVVAGNGADTVTGSGVSYASVSLGNGNDRVSLSGGNDAIATGSGNDDISVTGYGNWIDAGGASSFNEIHGGSGLDTFVLGGPGQGYDKIFGFSLSNGDALDLERYVTPGGWDGKMSDFSHWFYTVVSNGNTMLEYQPANGQASPIAELMGVSASLKSIEHATVI